MIKKFRINKKTAIHLSIIIIFVIYLFQADFIFNKLLKVDGESRLQNIDLPVDNSQVTFHIDDIIDTKIKWKEVKEVCGWAFMQNRNNDNNRTMVVLKSQENTYIFDTIIQSKPDITLHFKETGLDLDNSGFKAFISKDLLENGRYNIGLCLIDGESKNLTYGNNYITKDNNYILNRFVSDRKVMKIPEENSGIIYSIDRNQEMSDEEKDLFEIIGWAFIGGKSIEDEKIYLVLKSEKDTYVFDTLSQKRPDVTAEFCKDGLDRNLDDSGFIANIPKEAIKNGRYKTGIYIKGDGVDCLQYTGNELTV
jgi:hypothetical protein